MRGRRAALSVLIVGVALLGAACGNDMSTSAVAPTQPERAGDADGGYATGERPEAKAEQPRVDQPGVDRKLVRAARLELTTPDVVRSADAARRVAEGEGGYSGQEDVGTDRATMTLQVPSDRLDAVVGKLSAPEIGEVTSRNQTTQDVTEQVVDVDARVRTQQASLDRVRALLARATSIDEIVRIESEVTRREAELESLLKRQQALAGSTAMSTVSLRFTRDGSAPVDEGNTFVGALGAGWDALLAAGRVVLQVIGGVLPFAVVLGVPAFLLLRWRRRGRARRPTEGATVSE